jgi:GNAT superfamily N-acetyltransferase
MTTHYEILRAAPADAARLTAIALASKRHWDYPEDWLARWTAAMTLTPDFITRNEVYSAALAGERIAFYGLIPSRPKAVLEHLWVLPEFMGQGIGRGLFAHALARCRELGIARLEIQSDPHAQGFYTRMGARQVGVCLYELDGQTRSLPILEISASNCAN